MEDCESVIHPQFATTNTDCRAVMDARVAFESRQGSPVTFSFATDKHLKSWPKLSPPNTQDASQLVANLQTEKIGAHYSTGA